MLWRWLQAGRGLALWRSADLGNPGASWTTPARDKSGNATARPTWQAESSPALIVESADNVIVETFRTVKTIRIALARGYGLRIDLTPASSRRLRAELAKAGEGSTYEFGGWDGKDCIILKPSGKCTLAQWAKGNPLAAS